MFRQNRRRDVNADYVRQPAISRDVPTIPVLIQDAVLCLIVLVIGIAGGLIVGFSFTASHIKELGEQSTNIGDVLLFKKCEAGQVLRFTGESFECSDHVNVVDDLDDVTAPDPEDNECICFNRTQREWTAQGPFVRVGDIPSFDENGTIRCENLPDNGGAPLCNALRWGTFVGTWNANTNAPTLSSGGCPFGDFYVVNVTGNTDLDGNVNWDVGDALACSATGWKRIGKDIPVLSVNGMTGDVSLSLGALMDVDLTGQMDGDFLQRVGGLWTPQEVFLELDDLLDVNAAGAALGNAIVFDGFAWELNDTCCFGGDTAQRQGSRAISSAGDQPIQPFPTPDARVEFINERADPGNNWSVFTNLYTAPITGYYGAWCNVRIMEPANAVTWWFVIGRLKLNGATIAVLDRVVGPTNGQGNTPDFSIAHVLALGFFRMDAGDTLEVELRQNNNLGQTVVVRGANNGQVSMTVMFHGPV